MVYSFKTCLKMMWSSNSCSLVVVWLLSLRVGANSYCILPVVALSKRPDRHKNWVYCALHQNILFFETMLITAGLHAFTGKWLRVYLPMKTLHRIRVRENYLKNVPVQRPQNSTFPENFLWDSMNFPVSWAHNQAHYWLWVQPTGNSTEFCPAENSLLLSLEFLLLCCFRLRPKIKTPEIFTRLVFR